MPFILIINLVNLLNKDNKCTINITYLKQKHGRFANEKLNDPR
jgi:hypothetical protein